jgi:diguanylate cyclase (GGDEF)-like protein
MVFAVGSGLRTDHFRSAPRGSKDVRGTDSAVRHSAGGWAEPESPIQGLSRWFWSAFGVLGVVLVAYLISLLVRRPDQHWTWLDGWVVCGIEGAAALLCIIRGLDRNPGRAAPLALGFGLLSWAIGDTLLTAESLGGATPATPSPADIFYLCFYPLAYVGAVLLLRSAMGRLSRPNWLDGVVAGLGAAAVCSAFAFHDILRATGGSVAAAATNLAYPIGDLLLLFLVIGGTVLLSGRRTMPWFLLAGGIMLNVIGDTANLFQSSIFASRVGSDLNAIAWPGSILLMSMSVWLKPRTLDPLRSQRVAGFTLPSLAAFGALGILVFGSLHPVARVALGLATVTILTVGLRLTLSARDLRLLTEERHRQAQTDELTSLGNRRHLFHVLDTFFADYADPWTTSRELAFLFIDLNRFKEINDSFGHPAGDELLRQLGPRLQRAVTGTNGSVFRLGGDELAVVLIGADAEGAVAVAERILAEIAEPFFLHKMSATVGASIGIALAPSDSVDSTGLTWCADTAMYRAKLGQIPYTFYNQELDGGEQRINLVEELRVAVEEGGFVLHYQPQLDLHSGQILAVEALVRWPHPRLGLVPPLKFLPLAEDAGLMGALTKWVLGEALTQCAAWRSTGTHLAVSVNVSTSNLLDEGFTELAMELLAQRGLPPEALVIEITETSIITDFNRSKQVIEGLKDLGIVVSIDDFGAGFTSLAYLSSLAVGELKLDRTFIADLGAEGKERDLELVRATIQLGHDMKLRVVAEGIEDVATLELLSELGCDLAQGYFISRPMPADKLAFRSSAIAPPDVVPVG